VENKIANPGPLGLCGFALTTFFLSCWNAGILKETDVPVVIGLAVFYGGIAQFAAGMWEFRTGNTFGATAFTSYGAFWLSFAALLIPGFGVGAAVESTTAVGYYLIGWTIFTAIMLVASFRMNGALVAVFVVLTITFLLLAIGKLGGAAPGQGLTQLGGYLGILTALLAWYAAMAGLLSSVGWNLLPTYNFKR
jgi:succinate-acetate transporter protein